tara:strand:+ start:670 stop:1782 length:1113 start_codon:yes stop_codon:yes gene_type:complete
MARVPWNKGLKTGIKPPNYIEISKEELIEYIKQELNAEKIGEQFGVDKATILKRIYEYGLWDMYEEHAVRWEISDIKKEGLICNGCKFVTKFEDRLEHYYYSSTRRGELYRSSYSGKCKSCNKKEVKKNYKKRILAKDPDYKFQSSPSYWSNELWEAECQDCKETKHYHEFRKDFNRTNESIRTHPLRRPVSSYCLDPCNKARNVRRFVGWDMYDFCYDNYKRQMIKEKNELDILTKEEFVKDYWPKNNKCPVRNDITLCRYPPEERELWTSGGRHWPFTPTIDHIYPDKPLSKDNFWIISWRANEIKSDMYVAEVEALYHALMQRKGKVYVGEEAHELMNVRRKINDISNYVGKYPKERLESIKRHRKL